METIEPIFIAYVSLQVMAIIPIFFGSHLAVEEGQKEEAEQVSANDAYLFPAIGSVCLFSFYLVFKFFPKEYVNYLLTAYFGIFGTVAMVQVLVRFAQCFLPKPLEMAGHIHMRAETAKKETIFDFNITWLNVLVSLGSSLFTAYYVWSKNWIASNVFGEAFAISAISMIHLDTFKTGMILLAGLFVYDVFWVFGTDVMVTVAKSFDVPVKLLFPKDVLADATANFTMLGLGDIVIPGIQIQAIYGIL